MKNLLLDQTLPQYLERRWLRMGRRLRLQDRVALQRVIEITTERNPNLIEARANTEWLALVKRMETEGRDRPTTSEWYALQGWGLLLNAIDERGS